MCGHSRLRDQQRDEEPYGRERELELADRIAEQASLPPSQRHLARAAARHRLGRGPSHFEQPPTEFAAGEPVRHHDLQGDVRPGRVVRTHTRDRLVEVDFGQHGTSLVEPDQLERQAA